MTQATSDEKRFRLRGELPRVSPHALRFRAEHADLDRQVEFRILPEDASDEDRQVFEREVSELARLDHPSFLPVLDAGASRGRPFYVVPLREEALPLARRRNDERFSIEERCLVARALAAAYAEAHQRRIVLGAPSPVLLTWDRLQPRLAYVHHRATAAVKALPLPEGAPEGLVRWTPAGDVFHWGYFAYWCITRGKLPYASARGAQKPIRSVVPELAPDLAQVIDASVSRDEALRPEHGLQVWAVLLRRPANRAGDGGGGSGAGGGSGDDTAESVRQVRQSIDDLRTQGDLPEIAFHSGVHSRRPAAVPTSAPEARSLDLRLLGGALVAAMGLGLLVALGGPGPSPEPPQPAAAPSSGPRYASPAKDPFVKLLLAYRQVAPKDFGRLFAIAERLRAAGRLPEEGGGGDRLAGIKEVHTRDPVQGAEALERWIEDLREVVGKS